MLTSLCVGSFSVRPPSVAKMGEACLAWVAYMSYADETPGSVWCAVKVKTRSELTAEVALLAKGVGCYLPVVRERRRYSDRIRSVDRALFPGYLFCRIDPENTLPVISTPLVQYLVGNRNGPISIGEHEIDVVQRMAESGAHPTAFISTGSRVRVRVGKLAGIEGIIVATGTGARLVVSVELLTRSIAVEVDEEQVELLQ